MSRSGFKRGQPCSIDDCDKLTIARGLCNMHYTRWKNNGDPLITRKSGNGETARYVTVAALYEEDDCLIWPFGRGGNGYGKITLSDGRRMVASRAVCEVAHGLPPTSKHHAAHSCGHGHLGCVSPKHLRWATPKENSADREIHGTSNKGERHGISKLKSSDIPLIKKRLYIGEPQTKIARDFGVSQAAISRIKRGATWGWLSEDIR